MNERMDEGTEMIPTHRSITRTSLGGFAAALTLVVPLALLTSCGGGDTGTSSTATPVTATTTAPETTAPVDDAAATDGAATGGAATDGAATNTTAAPVNDIFRIADAERLLDEMIEVYSTAPAITDYVVQESWLVDREQELREYRFYGGTGKEMRCEGPDSMFLWHDGNVYATARTWPDRFLRVRGVDDLFNHTMNEFGGFNSPLKIHMALRLAKTHKQVIDGLDIGSPVPSKISSYRRRTDNQGIEREVLSIISGSGSARYYIDPETKLIMEADVEWAPPDAPDGMLVTKHLVFHPEILDALPEPLGYDPGDRIRVTTIAALLGRKKD